MERESLASRVIEMGPSTTHFKVPVLLEVPHFASVRGGERELIVLRCDDGNEALDIPIRMIMLLI